MQRHIVTQRQQLRETAYGPVVQLGCPSCGRRLCRWHESGDRIEWLGQRDYGKNVARLADDALQFTCPGKRCTFKATIRPERVKALYEEGRSTGRVTL